MTDIARGNLRVTFTGTSAEVQELSTVTRDAADHDLFGRPTKTDTSQASLRAEADRLHAEAKQLRKAMQDATITVVDSVARWKAERGRFGEQGALDTLSAAYDALVEAEEAHHAKSIEADQAHELWWRASTSA